MQDFFANDYCFCADEDVPANHTAPPLPTGHMFDDIYTH